MWDQNWRFAAAEWLSTFSNWRQLFTTAPCIVCFNLRQRQLLHLNDVFPRFASIKSAAFISRSRKRANFDGIFWWWVEQFRSDNWSLWAGVRIHVRYGNSQCQHNTQLHTQYSQLDGRAVTHSDFVPPAYVSDGSILVPYTGTLPE